MKSKTTSILSVLWLTLALASLPALRAQESPPAAVAPAAETPAAAVVPAADETKATVAPAPAAGDVNKLETKTGETAAEPEKPAPKEKKPKGIRGLSMSSDHRSSNERISFGHDSTLAAGEQAEAVVSIFGSSTSAGEVSDAVVSVFGNTRVTGGTVGDAAVAVLGNNYVNGHVKGEVVAVLGNVELGPDAVVDGEIVCIGGEVKRDAKATVRGNVQNVAIGGRHFNFEKLQTWFTECLLYGRPLAFSPNLQWVKRSTSAGFPTATASPTRR